MRIIISVLLVQFLLISQNELFAQPCGAIGYVVPPTGMSVIGMSPSAPAPAVTAFPSSTATLNGDFIVDSDFFIDADRIFIAPNVSIIVMPGVSLQIINSSQLFACGSGMWDGIKLLGDASLIISNSSIEDAKIGVYATINSNGNLKVDNAAFNKNHIGIELNGADVSNGNFYVGNNSRFTCTQLVNSPSTGTTLLSPFSGQRSHQHIYAHSVTGTVVIGHAQTPKNLFENTDFGIYSSNSNVEINQ
jgi:hypothetical protein